MPGPPPTPTHLKLIRGNPGKRPIRPEPEPQVPAEVPEPPRFLSGYAADEWWRVAPELHRLGLLSVLDVGPFAAYCVAYHRWRTAEEALASMAEKDALTGGLLVKRADGNAAQNPLAAPARCRAAIATSPKAWGLTPSSAASVKRSEILTVPRPSADEVIDVVEPDRADQDEIDRDNIVQQSRHQQNQYPASEGSERQEMGDGPHHYGRLSSG
jgi:P27 family predicted phage terminase small subunit